MRTGKARSEGQAFHRRLLSEYNTEITLENYVSYFELKPIAKTVEQLRMRINKLEANDPGSPMSCEGTLPTVSSTPTTTTEKRAGTLTMLELVEQRRCAEDEFFEQLDASFEKVKNYLLKLEVDLLSRVKELRQLTEEEIRARPEERIPQLYVKVQSILQYRALNLAAFRKIMKKFMERCACDSLSLQQRLMAVDDIISSSALSQPRINLRRIALDLIALYGTVFHFTYEETVAHLSRYEHKAGVNIRRILPHSDTFFFTLNFPHQERPGDFAVRILPGNTSIFCQKMICEVLQCERFPPCCTQFPNGEINVNLPRAIRGDDVFVLQSLVKRDPLALSHSGTFMELALMLHAAKMSSAARITAVIPYIAYTASVSSMAAVAELLETMGCQHVITVDLSSEQVEGMFSVPLETISAKYEFVRYIANHLTNEGHDFRNITIVATTGASVNRARHFADALMQYKELSSEDQFVSVCTAVQRQMCVPQQQQQQTVLSPVSGDHYSCTQGGVEGEASSFSSSTDREVAAHTSRAPIEPLQTSLMNPDKNANATDDAGGSGISNSKQQKQQQQKQLQQPSVSPSSEQSHLSLGGACTLAFEQALRRQEEGICAIRNVPVDDTTATDDVLLVGDVKDRLCIIVDTFIDEAIIICRTAWKLREAGASRIILLATHFIVSGGAVERLIHSPIDLVVVTDSVDQDEVFTNPRIAQKLRVLPIAPLLARAIEKVHTENSLTTLFEM
ncbi:putative ribose-phosphate pyrophosphokinase [Trypanosoma grayi]|uniref:putative ribose-phosphate pyrophosphokinase n=1 Tax=Trypanosoma grayi TaxID=71804 RepID=UPI0004F47031|nr:putative ribose-phosphate pyrophosphokinase [Trypanosoma grayi]KEG12688.1 putative ribose-phosphate pyrophosphokinase [Trypanosoma grayi]